MQHSSQSVLLKRKQASQPGIYFVPGGHAVRGCLVRQVQGASDDSDLIVRQVPTQPLLQAMRIH